NEANAWTSLWNVSLPKMIAAVTMGTGLFKLLPHMPYLASIVYLCASFVSTTIGIAIGTHMDAATQAQVADWNFIITIGLAIGTRMDAATQAEVTDWIVVSTFGSIAGIYVYDTALNGLSKDGNRLKPSFLGGVASVVLGVGLMMAGVWIMVSYYDQ
ncbi:hypothetical protein MKW92_048944, partial [Papaver armeniacum]